MEDGTLEAIYTTRVMPSISSGNPQIKLLWCHGYLWWALTGKLLRNFLLGQLHSFLFVMQFVVKEAINSKIGVIKVLLVTYVKNVHVCRNGGQKMKNFKNSLAVFTCSSYKYTVDSYYLTWALKHGPLLMVITLPCWKAQLKCGAVPPLPHQIPTMLYNIKF